MMRRVSAIVMVGICGIAVAAYGIERDSEVYTQFMAEFRDLRLRMSTPDVMKKMTPRFEQLQLVDRVKAVLNLASGAQAPTLFDNWFRAVETGPDIVEVVLFVTRTLDPDHDPGYTSLLEHAAQIAIDLLRTATLSGVQRLQLRETFECQLTSALANNYRRIEIGIAMAHAVVDLIDGYSVPAVFPLSRAYYMRIYQKYSAMGLELDSPEDRGAYPYLK